MRAQNRRAREQDPSLDFVEKTAQGRAQQIREPQVSCVRPLCFVRLT